MKKINTNDLRKLKNTVNLTKDEKERLHSLFDDVTLNLKNDMIHFGSKTLARTIESFYSYQLNMWKKEKEHDKERKNTLKMREKGMTEENIDKLIFAKRKTNAVQFKVGDVYLMNFLFTPVGEVSFIHPALILEIVNSGRVFVFPATSTKEFVAQAKKDIKNNKERSSYYLYEYIDNNGVKKEAVYVLDNTKTVSIERIIKDGFIRNLELDSKIFNEIRTKVFQLNFPRFFNELNEF
ncbi:hypothetical protein [Planococcus sp. 4-30]|uniref:hypothetical protein n=1 Tax=Planococcus sp. 4-30 TaxID=2874583 RepID=UPI001CBC5266|nr:hypothetical protein [Planococcus sp. 4-30]